MRVSNVLTLAALLCASAVAQDFSNTVVEPVGSADPSSYLIRSENNGNKADSRSKKYYTDVFNMASDSHGASDEFEGMYLVGLIIGFITTGFFVIFGAIVIVKDEVDRHKKFAANV